MAAPIQLLLSHYPLSGYGKAGQMEQTERDGDTIYEENLFGSKRRWSFVTVVPREGSQSTGSMLGLYYIMASATSSCLSSSLIRPSCQ